MRDPCRWAVILTSCVAVIRWLRRSSRSSSRIEGRCSDQVCGNSWRKSSEKPGKTCSPDRLPSRATNSLCGSPSALSAPDLDALPRWQDQAIRVAVPFARYTTATLRRNSASSVARETGISTAKSGMRGTKFLMIRWRDVFLSDEGDVRRLASVWRSSIG